MQILIGSELNIEITLFIWKIKKRIKTLIRSVHKVVDDFK